MVDPSLCALGRLFPDGPWVGLRRVPGGHQLVFGEVDGSVRAASTRPQDLLAAALAYVQEALHDGPPELEATQRDLADVIAALRSGAGDPVVAGLLHEALEGIEDGLAGDVVSSRLERALAAMDDGKEQADALDLLLRSYRAAVG